jgi:hypothetical protein
VIGAVFVAGVVIVSSATNSSSTGVLCWYQHLTALTTRLRDELPRFVRLPETNRTPRPDSRGTAGAGRARRDNRWDNSWQVASARKLLFRSQRLLG